MKENFRIIAVTPAGRRRYLEILLKYLERDRAVVDEWHLWLNTTNEKDIAYCKSLEKKYDWVKTIPLGNDWDGSWTIHHFFKNCVDPNSIYIRFDDDIVWIEPGALKRLVQFRIQNPQYFLIFPNIVNNSLMSHLHQRFGLIDLGSGICEYAILDKLGWQDPHTAIKIHNAFFDKLKHGSLDDYKFPQWVLYFRERFSINSFCFFGKDFAKFEGRVGRDEEVWLSEDYPNITGLMNCVYGRSVIVHFAYHTQRDWIEENTDILTKYKGLAGA